MRSTWDVEVDNRGESAFPSAEFVVTGSWSVTLWRVQLIEIDPAVLATRREAHIVGIPVNAHDLALVSCEAHTVRNGTCVEIEYVDILILDHASEKMATI